MRGSKLLNISFLVFFCTSSFLSCQVDEKKVKVGLDVLREKHMALLEGKKVGIITNQTGIASSGEHIVDILSKFHRIEISALFAPEHGIRGDFPDAVKVASYIDEKTGIRIWSLYGEHLKPTRQMLEDIDVLLFDVQDVGARFYTFISTMGLAMEAAAETGKEFIVLDRPNPITGTIIEGPILEKQYASFVGKYPIPIRYGMTPGELAGMIKGEDWMERMERLALRVIPLEGWRRDMWFDETGLPWIKPSPNIPSILTAALYPGLCLVEALNVSEGRGTMRPFEQFGAPWIDSVKLAGIMNDHALPGIYFKPVSYTPVSLPGVATQSKYRDERVHGLEMIITDREEMRPVHVMVYLLVALKKIYPEKLELRKNLERLIGIQSFRDSINEMRRPDTILEEWEIEIEEFKKSRKKYLLYK
ncbi:MAG: DUF1343 domain-containing protein [Candidatus Aminicenantes bacterium]|nr:MAG: DUF1343 domain-containing protein [Candidatus Aminicenantes bacterium]